MRSLLLLSLCVVVVLSRRLPEEDEIGGPIPLCSDGKGALLEAGRVFKCSQTCPDGFFCEFRDEAKTLERGICCPDLAKLYEIYGDAAASDADAKVLEIELRRKGAGSAASNAHSVEEGHREEIVVDLTKLDEADAAQGEGEATKPESSPAATENPANALPTRGELESQKDLDRTYTCKRQRFELTCKNGSVPTQFTLRWYAKDGKCCSYPYGFCPGSLIMNDDKIRTKQDCEEYCVDPERAPPVHDVPTSPEEAKIGKNFEDFASPPPPFSKIPTKEELEAFERMKQKACVRSSPYRDTCPDTKMPSQFVLRWHVKNGKCCSYPYGYCHGDTVITENLIRTKTSCEKHCLKGAPVSKEMLTF